MSTARRVQEHPAYLLHHRPFRDTSLLLDIFSRDFGKLTLVARGVRGAKSRLKGLLRPFMPLRVSWVLRTDLGTLTGAELCGQPLSLTGDSLLSGYYVNELVLHFLHRHDPQPELFEAYQHTLTNLAAAEPAPVLRGFEIELLRLLGYALNVEQDASTHQDIEQSASYEYRVERGPVKVSRASGAMIFSGEHLIGIRDHRFHEPLVLQAANRLLRSVISHHLDGRELKSRKVLVDVHRGRVKMSDSD